MTNAFTWGFDGWIYACHGYANDSKVEGSDHRPITMNSGNTYRMRADGSHAEYFTHGQVNPFGLAFDPLDNLYSCDCHSQPLYQLLRGAYYPSFGKPDDGLGFGPEMVNTDHGSTGIGGISFYTADQYPEAYRGTTFIGNVVTNRVNHDRIEWHGSSPRGIQQADFVWSEDNWFHPVDIELGPDGALYIADFYNSHHRPLRGAADSPRPRPRARAHLAGRLPGQRRQAGAAAFRDRSDQVVGRRADQGPGPPQPDRANHGRQPACRPRRRGRPLGGANGRRPGLTAAPASARALGAAPSERARRRDAPGLRWRSRPRASRAQPEGARRATRDLAGLFRPGEEPAERRRSIRPAGRRRSPRQTSGALEHQAAARASPVRPGG